MEPVLGVKIRSPVSLSKFAPFLFPELSEDALCSFAKINPIRSLYKGLSGIWEAVRGSIVPDNSWLSDASMESVGSGNCRNFLFWLPNYRLHNGLPGNKCSGITPVTQRSSRSSPVCSLRAMWPVCVSQEHGQGPAVEISCICTSQLTHPGSIKGRFSGFETKQSERDQAELLQTRVRTSLSHGRNS